MFTCEEMDALSVVGTLQEHTMTQVAHNFKVQAKIKAFKVYDHSFLKSWTSTFQKYA